MFMSNGFDDYISKPIDIRQMYIVMNKYVRDKQPPEVLETVRDFKAKEEKQKKESKKTIDPTNDNKKLLTGGIAGLDIPRGLKRYHNDEKAYLRVLKSFSIAVRDMLGYIKTVDADTLDDYKIRVHGIKGACYDVFAGQLADMAKELEDAAVEGNTDYIEKNNADFIVVIKEFLDKIDHLLLENSNDEKTGAKSKPIKDKIDKKKLSELLKACKDYDMSSVDRSIAEIEKYDYKSDKKLSVWLRENVDMINFAEIVNRITDEGGSAI